MFAFIFNCDYCSQRMAYLHTRIVQVNNKSLDQSTDQPKTTINDQHCNGDVNGFGNSKKSNNKEE